MKRVYRNFTPVRFLDRMEAIGFIMSGDMFIFPRGLEKPADLSLDNFGKLGVLFSLYRNITPGRRKALLQEAEKRMQRRARHFDAVGFIDRLGMTNHNLGLMYHGDRFIKSLMYGASVCERFGPVPTELQREMANDLMKEIVSPDQRALVIDETRKKLERERTSVAPVVGTVGDGFKLIPKTKQAA